jgi:hypothetical protein
MNKKKDDINNEVDQKPKTPSFMKIYDPYSQFDKSKSTQLEFIFRSQSETN